VIFTAGGVKLSRSLRGGRVQRAEIPVSLFAEAIDGDPKKAPPAAVRWLATTQGRRLNYRRTCPLVRRNERRGSAALIGRLERCIFRSRRRTTSCEFSARLFLRANPVHGGLSSQVVGGRRRSRSSWPSAGSRSPAANHNCHLVEVALSALSAWTTRSRRRFWANAGPNLTYDAS